MKTFLKLLGLALIDYLLIWIFVKQMDPDPSASMEIFILVPFTFGINIIIAGILNIFKNKNSKLLFINSVIAPIIMLILFNMGISRHINERSDTWKFLRNDTVFYISKDKETKMFDIIRVLDERTEMGYISGSWEAKNDSLILVTEKYRMYILKNKLINFGNDSSEITIDKIRY